jgi:hypothetical protein
MMKYIMAVALATPFLIVSSTAHTTRQITSGGDIFAMDVNAKTPHAYRGGPRTAVPHGK